LAKTRAKYLEDAPVICSVLRAGLPLHNGLLKVFDQSENAFVAAYRVGVSEGAGFKIVSNYVASPDLNGKTLIIADPMLATGQSLVAAYNALKDFGVPKQIHLVSVIGSQQGVDFICSQFPENSHLWIADIDPQLNEKGYIVPGLGDSGDLTFGKKLNH
jgi:uracil phosphoribosyltransferase